jgi:hypothetical protein
MMRQVGLDRTGLVGLHLVKAARPGDFSATFLCLPQVLPRYEIIRYLASGSIIVGVKTPATSYDQNVNN